MYFGDSDEPIKPDKEKLIEQGVKVTLWPDNMSTEERIVADLPMSNLQKFVDAAADELWIDRVLSAIETQLGVDIVKFGPYLENWIGFGNSEKNIRKAVGKAAKKSGWFKDLNCGEKLGYIVAEALDSIPEKPLAKILNEIRDWIYGKRDSTASG